MLAELAASVLNPYLPIVLGRTSVTLLLSVTINLCHAQTFDFNDNCRKAYNTIFSLKLNEGASLLKIEEKKAPDNLIPLYLDNYVDFLQVYTTIHGNYTTG